MNFEVLSPAGNMEKLKTAVYFGADAVYFSGKQFGLRAFANNFSNEEIYEACKFCHDRNVKAYVTVNIIAHNGDFNGLKEYLELLENAGVDAVIVADLGVAKFVKKYAPKLDLHISTQANITNKYTAKMYADFGAKRIVMARELTLSEVREIKDFIPQDVEIEAFVHGAMCISYSGRCLLSNYLTGRNSNRGECVQACRWKYTINACGRENEKLPIEEDSRGTYILNSKDMNMIEYLRKLMDAGISSFKIEGRMKSSYYVATTVNAYKRALLLAKDNKPCPQELVDELLKTSNRTFTTGFYFKDKENEESENLESSNPVQTHEFMAVVTKDAKDGKVQIQQRNRFKKGDELEVLSPNETFNKKFTLTDIRDLKGEEVIDAKNVQQDLIVECSLPLKVGDILRKKI